MGDDPDAVLPSLLGRDEKQGDVMGFHRVKSVQYIKPSNPFTLWELKKSFKKIQRNLHGRFFCSCCFVSLLVKLK